MDARQAALEELVEFHSESYPDREPERIRAEVRDYLRRAACMGPDLRELETSIMSIGQYDMITFKNKALLSGVPITSMYREAIF